MPVLRDPLVDRASASGIWQRRSTREVAKADRFEFWRQFAAGAHMERPLGARGDFFGEFEYAATSDGVVFGKFEIDPCVSRFGPGRDDAMVDIGMLNAGVMHIRYGRDQALALHAGAGLVLFDPARPMTTHTTRSNLAYLSLPRSAVVAALGGDAIPRDAAVRPFAPGALAAQLAACLRGLQGEGAAAVTDALHTASALALVALANLRGVGHHWPGELEAALYRAACYQLTLHTADPRARVAAVAAVLGCSRAQLYRLFAAHGQSVSGYLYELRMQQAATVLRTRPVIPVGALTLLCGYGEPAAFNKAFRRRFGMTPRDLRAALAESVDATV